MGEIRDIGWWAAGPTRARRSFHVLDLENLYGPPPFVAGRAEAAVGAWARAARVGPLDHGIAACARPLAAAAAFALPPQVRLRVSPRRPDGADETILAELDAAWVARRYWRVVVASGDHAFAGVAEELRSRGVLVECVSLAGKCHWTLYRAVDRLIALDGAALAA